MMRNASASSNHASADSIVGSKSFDKRLARLIQPSVRSTTQRLGNTTNPLTPLSARLTTVTAMRLASNAARCASSPYEGQKSWRSGGSGGARADDFGEGGN